MGSASAKGDRRRCRGAAMLWSVVGLALALAMAPLYVGLCRSLIAMTARHGHRLVATQRGEAELERLRAGEVGAGSFAVPELPEGRGRRAVRRRPGSPVAEARVTIVWTERGVPVRSEWVTLVTR